MEGTGWRGEAGRGCWGNVGGKGRLLIRLTVSELQNNLHQLLH